MKRGTVQSILLGCLLSVFPCYGTITSQGKQDIFLKAIGYHQVEETQSSIWEPIPIEREEITVTAEINQSDLPVIKGEYGIIEQIKDEQRAGDIELIAQLICCEGENQPYEGKVAIGCCVLNMVDSDRHPNDVYSVIFSGAYNCAVNGKFSKAGWCVTEEDYKAAEEAYSYRPYECMYFRTKHYHNFGEPLYQIGDHFFSK